MAAIKLDLHVLVLGKLAWGDNIPDDQDEPVTNIGFKFWHNE